MRTNDKHLEEAQGERGWGILAEDTQGNIEKTNHKNTDHDTMKQHQNQETFSSDACFFLRTFHLMTYFLQKISICSHFY